MPQHRRMVSTTIYMTPEQEELLHKLSEVTRVPLAVFLRDGIDLVIARERRRLDAPAPQRLLGPVSR